MNAIKRFGSAMIVPVLLFAFFGIVLGLATLFNNPMIMGSIAEEGTMWNSIWTIVESGGWTILTTWNYYLWLVYQFLWRKKLRPMQHLQH